MDLPQIHNAPYLSLDCETDGLKWWENKIFGIAMSLPGGDDYYWDVRRTPRILEWLAREMPRYKGIVINQHVKFDAHMLREVGVILPPGYDCTMTRAALIDEHRMTYDLDSLGRDCIGEGKGTEIYEQLARLFGGKPTPKAQGPNFHKAPYEIMAKYAKKDTRTALRVWEWQNDEIDRQELHQVAALERELMPVIVRMEHGGVHINVEKTERAAADIDRLAKTLQYQLNNLAGFEVNPNPSGSIHRLFDPKRHENGKDWVCRDGTVIGSTEGGKPSIDASALRAMKDPAAALILRLRKSLKTRDTFLRGHMLGHHHNGVIHCNVNQTKTEADVGTGTGRFSINDPALQQIHKRDEDIAGTVRGCFEPDGPRYHWVCNDWAQMDFRVFAHYVKNPDILKMYREKPETDFHQLASDLTGIPRKPRFAGDANAKQINLGLIFGMGEGKLAQEMGLPWTVEDKIDRRTGKKVGEWIKPGVEAQAVFEKYHAAIPGVRDFLKNASSVARSRGFVRTMMGRRVRFPRGLFTHKAGGLIFQGTAADALKVKIIEVDRYLQSTNSGARLMLNVHDEFDSNVPKDRADIRAEITRIVTDFHSKDARMKFRVPIMSDQGFGPNWWEACKE